MTRAELATLAKDRLVGYDLDGVLADGFLPIAADGVIISGRRHWEWLRTGIQVGFARPIYLRPDGDDNDAAHAGRWKAYMCRRLGVGVFFEDNPTQAATIRDGSPGTIVIRVTNAAGQQCHRFV